MRQEKALLKTINTFKDATIEKNQRNKWVIQKNIAHYVRSILNQRMDAATPAHIKNMRSTRI